MVHQDFADITGSVVAPALPMHPNGAPRIWVKVTSAAEPLITWSAQASHTPMDFRLLLDCLAPAADAELAIEAWCSEATGSEEKIATHSQPLSLIDGQLAAPLHMPLAPLTDATPETPATGQPDTLEVHGNLIIPDALYQPDANLLISVLLIQENGQSNRYSSNIAELLVPRPRSALPFALTLDRATIPEGHYIKLYIILLDAENEQVLAGKSIKDIDPHALPDFSDIVLRPRRT